MTDFNPNQPDATQASPQEPPPTAFCQNCGKPLHADTVRRVGPAVYCEPCLAARLAGAPAGYTPVNNPPFTSGAAPTWVAGPPEPPNPGLAALLGFIPGVGAMYNEQYAKGIVHLIVFAVLVTFSHITSIFGLFILGWEAYMVIEAHHTAKARRDGTPLPNPFGLNDIGERFGFGRAWPSSAGFGGAPPHASHTATQAASQPAAQPSHSAVPDWNSAPPAASTPPPAARWQAEAQRYAENQAQNIHQQAFRDVYGSQIPPVVPPYTPADRAYGSAPFGAPPFVPPVAPSPLVAPRNRFPAGAVWLIGLGVLFLLATTGLFNIFRGEALVGFGMIGLGSWLFVHRMLGTGSDLADDGTPMYKIRLLGALRASVWIVTIGILLLLDNFRILYWHSSWPWLIIVAGVMALFQRAVYNSVATAAPFPAGAAPASPSAPYAGAPGVSNPVHSTELTPTDTPYGGS